MPLYHKGYNISQEIHYVHLLILSEGGKHFAVVFGSLSNCQTNLLQCEAKEPFPSEHSHTTFCPFICPFRLVFILSYFIVSFFPFFLLPPPFFKMCFLMKETKKGFGEEVGRFDLAGVTERDPSLEYTV